MKRLAIAAAALLLCAQAIAQDKSIAQKVDALLKQMTPEEKAGQLHQLAGKEFTGPANEAKTNKLNDIRNGRVGSMLNIKGVAETREIQALALQRA